MSSGLRFFSRLYALSISMTVIWATAAHAQLSEAQVAQFSQNADQKVIVIMRSQHPVALAGSNAEAERSDAITAEQAPLMDELRQVRASNVKSYRLVNAFAATVSKEYVARLRAHPAVAQVIPDVVIGRRRRAAATMTSMPANSAAASTSLKLNTIPGACGANGRVLLEPEGLTLTHTDSDDPDALTARSLGVTGAGVKVAWLADGLDPNNVNFIRPDGKSVFDPAIGGDYQDFTGAGPGVPTLGGEAFLDANTIAGQGIHVYNVSGFGAQPDPSACNVRIEGVAPGASLVGLVVLNSSGGTSTSALIQAIEYAVQTAHVDIINESLAGQYFPDVTALDAIKQFNDAAVAAGVVVIAVTSDAGSANTIGTPASDPLVISVGASTDYRFYAQTNFTGARYFATTGWLSNNISSLSSGGFQQDGATLDLVAPGEASFASCDANPSLFAECANFLGQPSEIEIAAGTSEGGPFVSGAAALVIEAYRQTHHGATPTPKLVKKILLSTATDLGTPATEQGAGLLNSYKAVLLAKSIHTADGSPKPVGNTLLMSTSQLNAIDAPGTQELWNLTVTNTGGLPQIVNLFGRILGPDRNVQTGSVTLNDITSRKFIGSDGVQYNYAVINFTVPVGAERLDASIAYPGILSTLGPGVLILIDPQGRFAANSAPQGIGNFGNVDVRFPVPGTWTGVIFSAVASLGGVNGTMPWRAAIQHFVPFASVQPNFLVLAPGQTQTVAISAATPASPGDIAGSIVLASDFGPDGITSIPVTLRSLVDVAKGGAFNGVLTGANGRPLPTGAGQKQYYEFRVPPGIRDITANVSLTNDANDPVGAYLISPDGDALGYGQNSLSNGTYGTSLTAYTLNPVSGTWTLIVDFAEPVVGNEVSQPFTGSIQFNRVKAEAHGLPNSVSQKLAAGAPITIPVTVTNDGAAPQEFFVDARLDATQDLTLPVQLGTSDSVALPNLSLGAPVWLVPTQTSYVTVSQTSSPPAMFDFSPFPGDPDSASSSSALCGTSESASYGPPGNTVTAGYWFASPEGCGPYPGPAPSGTATLSMIAHTKGFDPAVTSAPGDLWTASINPTALATFSPVLINPGQTGTIYVTITPSGAPGTVVRGTLYVDDFVSGVPPYLQVSGDELAAFPYAYTIK
jgi:Subtilase family/Peptidase inhibitor I9